MKKILYIIPIVVLAMVGLTQDAKAQSNPPVVTGQTGNASNGGTIITANTAGTNGLIAGNNNKGENTGGNNVTGGTNVGTVQAQPPTVQTTIRLALEVGTVGPPSPFSTTLKDEISKGLAIIPLRVSINTIPSG